MTLHELIPAIKNRPGHFLRKENIWELTAFIRGYSYCLFALYPNDEDEFGKFIEWLRIYVNEKDDDEGKPWISYITNNKTDKEAFSYFFELWELFSKEQLSK